MRKLVAHFTLVYFWLEKFLSKKKIRNSHDVAFSIVVTLPILYLAIFMIPFFGIFIENGSSLLREYKWVIASIFSLVIFPIILIFFKKENINKQLGELNKIENWQDSEMYQKGRYWVRFHIYFPYVSLFFVLMIGWMIILITK